jgi:hypothetical protein
MASDDDDPVPRTRCTKATNAKAPTRHALRRGERNNGSPSPNRNLTSSLGTFWAMSFHDWPVLRAVQPMMQLGVSRRLAADDLAPRRQETYRIAPGEVSSGSRLWSFGDVGSMSGLPESGTWIGNLCWGCLIAAGGSLHGGVTRGWPCHPLSVIQPVGPFSVIRPS